MKRVILLSTVCFAIISLQAQPERDFPIFTWAAEGAYLGVTLDDVIAKDAADLKLEREAGALVESVVADSPAERAGLQKGDVIVRFSGIPVLSARHLQRLVSDSPVGRTVDIEVVRKGQNIKVDAQLAERSASSRAYRFERRTPGPTRIEPGPSFRFELPEGRFELPEGGNRLFYFSDRPRLGIRGVALTGQLAEHLGVKGSEGVLVTEVLADSAAQKAGLLAGDAIVSVDGAKVVSVEALSSKIRSGKTHELEIVRSKATLKISVEIPGDEDSKGEKGVKL